MANEKDEKDPQTTARNKAYSKAMGDLKRANPDQWETLYAARCEEFGVTYRRRLSAEDKAREQIKALAAEYPALVAEVVGS